MTASRVAIRATRATGRRLFDRSGAGSTWSLAICRIALAASMLDAWPKVESLARSQAAVDAVRYVPKGLWQVLPGPPSVDAVSWISVVGWWLTVMLLIGAVGRVVLPAAVLSFWLLTSAAYSWQPFWSHGYNVIVLVGLAFTCADATGTLSVDAVVRRWRHRRTGTPSPPRDSPPGWPVMLGQMAAAGMFLVAAQWKVRSDPWGLGWVFSDNLRNDIGVSWWMHRGGPPELASWIIAEPWRWKSAAVANLVFQTMPAIACLMPRRPWVRAIGGACFVIEILGLGVVMGLWNLSWLWLAAFFIDWDRVCGRLARRSDPETTQPPRPLGRLATVWITAFLGMSAVAGLRDHTLAKRLAFYPFSRFTMFSVIRARMPYDRHAAWPFEATSYRPIDADGREPPAFPLMRRDGYVEEGLISTLRRAIRASDPASIRSFVIEADAAIDRRLQERGARVESGHDLAMHWVLKTLPPWPAPAIPVVVHEPLMAVLRDDGAVESAGLAVAPIDGGFLLTPWFEGFDDPEWRVEWADQLSIADGEARWSTLDRADGSTSVFIDESPAADRRVVLALRVRDRAVPGDAERSWHGGTLPH